MKIVKIGKYMVNPYTVAHITEMEKDDETIGTIIMINAGSKSIIYRIPELTPEHVMDILNGDKSNENKTD